MEKLRRILICVRMTSPYGRSVVRGVTRYARPERPWLLYIHDTEAGIAPLIRKIRPDGLIALSADMGPAETWIRRGLRAVGVGSAPPGSRWPRIANDEGALGRLAAEHFLSRGFRHFGYVDHVTTHGVSARGAAFRQALESAERPPLSYRRYSKAAPGSIEVDVRLRRWLASASKPLAVWAHDDSRGFDVLRACRAQGLRVPEDVAVLGSGNDVLMCEASYPPMSSIATPAERIGYRAASLLAAMLAGRRAPARPMFLPPAGIVTRQSTDIFALEDERVVRALRFISDHAHEAITVRDVLRTVPITRRRLEQQFHALLRRTPAGEIRRTRIERAKQILARTDVSMSEVARRSGFSDSIRLSEIFRRETGMPPSRFRRQFRLA